MHIRQIEKTELNGMTLQHTQTLPEIVYKGCVICFINFDGDIEGVGTRITDLGHEEFAMFKELISKIEFEDEDGYIYAKRAKLAMESIKKTAGQIVVDFKSNYFAKSHKYH